MTYSDSDGRFGIQKHVTEDWDGRLSISQYFDITPDKALLAEEYPFLVRISWDENVVAEFPE